MHAEIEKAYMNLLVEIGRAGLDRSINLVYSSKRKPGRFILITEGDYRENNIGTDGYDLIGVYKGRDALPHYSQVCEDIYAFIHEETEKEYGCRPELQRFAETG